MKELTDKIKRDSLGDRLWGNPEQYSLEHRIFNSLSLVGIFAGILTIITNLLLGNPFIHVLASTAAIILSLIAYIFGRFLKIHLPIKQGAIIFLIGIFTFLWFGGGLEGSAPYFYFILTILATFLLAGKKRKIYLITIFIIILLLVGIDRFFPEMITPYASDAQRYYDILTGFLTALIIVILMASIIATQYSWEKEAREKLLAQTIRDKETMEKALAEIKQLRGIIPICSACKNIRNDKGYWEKVEQYVHHHTEAEFSHGICPDCAKKMYDIETKK